MKFFARFASPRRQHLQIPLHLRQSYLRFNAWKKAWHVQILVRYLMISRIIWRFKWFKTEMTAENWIDTWGEAMQRFIHVQKYPKVAPIRCDLRSSELADLKTQFSKFLIGKWMKYEFESLHLLSKFGKDSTGINELVSTLRSMGSFSLSDIQMKYSVTELTFSFTPKFILVHQFPYKFTFKGLESSFCFLLTFLSE